MYRCLLLIITYKKIYEYVLIKCIQIQVSKIEVQYDKTAKQVDVHILKETLWDHMQEFVQAPEMVSALGHTCIFNNIW